MWRKTFILSLLLVLAACGEQRSSSSDKSQDANPTSPEQRTLVIALLTVESSQIQNIERSVTTLADTVQYWISTDAVWSIRTYGIDRAMEVNRIQPVPEKPVDYFVKSTKRRYRSVIDRLEILQFTDYQNAEHVKEVFAKAGLDPGLAISEQGFAYWKPEGVEYSSTSPPKK